MFWFHLELVLLKVVVSDYGRLSSAVLHVEFAEDEVRSEL